MLTESGSPLPTRIARVSMKWVPDDPAEIARMALHARTTPRSRVVTVILTPMDIFF
jgi:hypothetical protein